MYLEPRTKLVAPRSQVKPASFQHHITVRNETFYSEFHLSYSYTYGSLLLSHRGPDREIFDVVYDVLGWLLSSKIHSKTSFLKDIDYCFRLCPTMSACELACILGTKAPKVAALTRSHYLEVALFRLAQNQHGRTIRRSHYLRGSH